MCYVSFLVIIEVIVKNSKQNVIFSEHRMNVVETSVNVCTNYLVQDPDAKKPDDWDERENIDDPDDSKPEDWDKPEHIPDPDAKKPDDWDDEMDGEWEPPMIDNPEYKVRSAQYHN